MSNFQQELKSLGLTYAQEELIKQAVDKYVISMMKEIWLKNDLPSLLQSDDYIKTREELRVEQRQALYGNDTSGYTREEINDYHMNEHLKAN